MKQITFFLLLFSASLSAQELITNIHNRNTISLNGDWSVIIDPYENGFYNYRYEESSNGYFKNQKPKSVSDLVEYDFDKSPTLKVPGDWNTQRSDLFFYEGTIWYKKSFTIHPVERKRYFIHFGAVNYNAKVYLNGEKLGEHTGGFTPFNFEITALLKEDENFVVVKVDNKRVREGVPTLNTDWWNYGGITRDVNIVATPEIFVQDYFIQLEKNSMDKISGWVKLEGSSANQDVTIKINEAGIEHHITADKDGYCNFSFKANLKLWSPENPKLYDVVIETPFETLNDQIGFRRIEVAGNEILLNGKSQYLRGISIHEESPLHPGRAVSIDDAEQLLKSAKELGCNFVRLAHYPHNEHIIRLADKLGMLVWSEIPVYWTILWDNKETYSLASQQLSEMINRDKNRASIIIWSVANETPRSEKRLTFLSSLIKEARNIDPTRLISAATELTYNGKNITVDDPLSQHLDVIGANEYLGWYSYSINDMKDFTWKSEFQKPLVISEFGGGALYNNHGNEGERWTEEYQDAIYREQISMLKNVDFIKGMSPWILYDFRSPRRPLPGIQDYYNRKGLISNDGNKKLAFFTLKKFYESKMNEE
ncbi:MAG: beta-glucuronidase [Ignavibacteriales bacterium]|nr:MAG: beta-glucuronidase [Ignavibacteriales bacterium]